jgi:hypothetical protein
VAAAIGQRPGTPPSTLPLPRESASGSPWPNLKLGCYLPQYCGKHAGDATACAAPDRGLGQEPLRRCMLSISLPSRRIEDRENPRQAQAAANERARLMSSQQSSHAHRPCLPATLVPSIAHWLPAVATPPRPLCSRGRAGTPGRCEDMV